jgi:hypothetical protein
MGGVFLFAPASFAMEERFWKERRLFVLYPSSMSSSAIMCKLTHKKELQD